MKVYLLQNVERVGLAGELLNVSEGYAKNFLFPKKLAVQITPANEKIYLAKIKTVENRKAVIESETSMLSEKISGLVVKLQEKVHDDKKLYAAVSASEIADALKAQHGIAVSKSQVLIEKSIKTVGQHEVVIKLSSKLQPRITVAISALK